MDSALPIVGREGHTLQVKWSEHPVTYLSIATDGFQNLFCALRPNSALGGGSLLAFLEKKIDYFITVIKKLPRERIKTIEVKEVAVKDFDEYLEHYFPQAGIIIRVDKSRRFIQSYRTAFTEKCPSWYKRGKEEGRITAIWPGSGLHALRTFAHPRWEDFNYELLDGHRNRFHWLGNGCTVNERDGCGDCAWYMDEIDYPPVPE